VPLEQAEDWIVHMYCDSESVCEPAFTGVKLRSWPPRGGPTAHARTAVNEPLTELSRWLCAEIGYRGIGDLDWRFDRRDGRYKLLDFNPRIGAQFRLFETHAGIDVVRALHLDLTGRRIPASRQVQGRRFVVENLYLSALLSPGERAALAPDLPRSRPKHLELAWFALDDLVPALVMAGRLGGARAVRVSVAICRWLGRFHGPRIPRRRRTA
jgi:predicted ATP-grasp superfamily ATP-dependent carboligase